MVGIKIMILYWFAELERYSKNISKVRRAAIDLHFN
jgi:hypothetical protein